MRYFHPIVLTLIDWGGGGGGVDADPSCFQSATATRLNQLN